MGWRDLLQTGDETLVSPWVGGRSLRSGPRTWTIDGRLPREMGWYSFKLNGRRATLNGSADPASEGFRDVVRGYLVGDRLVPDGARVNPDPTKIAEATETVLLVDRGLDRFVRIAAGRLFDEGPLIFMNQEMPVGPEDAVSNAYLRRLPSVSDIAGVTPALEAAFRMEVWQREEAERRRLELERQRREEEERRQREERREQMARQLGTGTGRREMALVDFAEAARAALRVGGAEYLDHRASYRPGEMVVTFRMLNRAFMCTCDEKTLRIIDAGVCLGHGDERGDTRFTLESLPAVINEAHRTHRLVVLRHVGDQDEPDWRNDDD